MPSGMNTCDTKMMYQRQKNSSGRMLKLGKTEKTLCKEVLSSNKKQSKSAEISVTAETVSTKIHKTLSESLNDIFNFNHV